MRILAVMPQTKVCHGYTHNVTSVICITQDQINGLGLWKTPASAYACAAMRNPYVIEDLMLNKCRTMHLNCLQTVLCVRLHYPAPVQIVTMCVCVCLSV